MNKLLTRLTFGAVITLLAGCSVSTKDSISIDPFIFVPLALRVSRMRP